MHHVEHTTEPGHSISYKIACASRLGGGGGGGGGGEGGGRGAGGGYAAGTLNTPPYSYKFQTDKTYLFI